MGAGTSFGIYFLAYAIVFVLVAVLVVAACFIGVKWRKNKDAKMMLTDGAAGENSKA
ncbi:hypothetical protein AALA90_07900 [Lachnospiraceae bacterium 38-10]